MERRTIIKAGAWAVPVIAVTVAVPAHAASTATQRVVLTNKTAGIGGRPNTIFINYKVKTTEGAADNVRVVVTGVQGGATIFEDARAIRPLVYRGDTCELVDLPFPGITKGEPVTVTVIVTCGDAYQDGFTKTIPTPGWWA